MKKIKVENSQRFSPEISMVKQHHVMGGAKQFAMELSKPLDQVIKRKSEEKW